jgi:GNAT superfamily N-acetyltransferase
VDPNLSGETLTSTVTYLEMLERPVDTGPLLAPRPRVTIVRAVSPTISFYRYLYDTVGAPWRWIDRRKMSDAALSAIVQDARVEVFVLYDDGVPAGYVELDLREMPDIELAYMGLVPDFIGKGLGSYLLRWAIAEAWSRSPARFWVHTCTLDHPGALPLYERVGFVRYKTETEIVAIPAGM